MIKSERILDRLVYLAEHDKLDVLNYARKLLKEKPLKACININDEFRNVLDIADTEFINTINEFLEERIIKSDKEFYNDIGTVTNKYAELYKRLEDK